MFSLFNTTFQRSVSWIIEKFADDDYYGMTMNDLIVDLPVPPGRIGHVGVSYGTSMMIIWGGYRQNASTVADLVANGGFTYFDGREIWIYNCFTKVWIRKFCTGINSPPGMSGSSAIVVDNAFYLFGGCDYYGEGFTNKIYKLDLNTFVWECLSPTGTPPFPVDKMVGWQYNRKFYVFGGVGYLDLSSAYDFQFVLCKESWKGWTNQFFMYDPVKNKWSIPSCSGTFPSARAAHACAVLKDKVYIFGGELKNHRLNDLHCLDLSLLSWSGKISVDGPQPEGRSWHSLTAVSPSHFLLYGGFSQTNVPLKDCWIFYTKDDHWLKIELPSSNPRIWHSACYLHHEVLIYGGCASNILDFGRKLDLPDHISYLRYNVFK